VTQAVLVGILVIALDHLFVGVLLRTSWAQDHLCAAHTGDALAACEMSDDLGFVATALVLMPLLGWLFGLVGGAFGLALRSGVTAAKRTTNRLLAPALFSGALAAIFIAELIWNLW
jgi:hypothetical protein